MRLSCPECQTEYEVPDAALAGRPRTLRCATCGKTWKSAAPDTASPAMVEAEIAPAAAEVQPAAGKDYTEAQSQGEAAVTPPAPEPLLSAARLKAVREAQAAKQAEPPSNTGLKISILVVIALIILALAEHRAIMTAWPPSARLFNALGLH